jgi:hypothetical protein
VLGTAVAAGAVVVASPLATTSSTGTPSTSLVLDFIPARQADAGGAERSSQSGDREWRRVGRDRERSRRPASSSPARGGILTPASASEPFHRLRGKRIQRPDNRDVGNASYLVKRDEAHVTEQDEFAKGVIAAGGKYLISGRLTTCGRLGFSNTQRVHQKCDKSNMSFELWNSPPGRFSANQTINICGEQR